MGVAEGTDLATVRLVVDRPLRDGGHADTVHQNFAVVSVFPVVLHVSAPLKLPWLVERAFIEAASRIAIWAHPEFVPAARVLPSLFRVFFVDLRVGDVFLAPGA